MDSPKRSSALALALLLALAAVAVAGSGFKTGEPGGPPSNHSTSLGGNAKLYVVASGAAPDGERYELVMERYPGHEEEDGNSESWSENGQQWRVCLTFDWPDVPRDANASQSYHCGSHFPPRLRRRAAPGKAAANTYGYLTPAPHTRDYLWVYGFSRPRVKRVEVRYKAPNGDFVEAPVQLTRLSRAVHKRLGSSTRVNVFVTFLPCSAGRFYDPATDDRESHGPRTPYEVVAYGKRGRELSRVKRTSLANGFQRCD